MAFTSGKAAILCALVALVALTELTAARSVPAVDDATEMEFVIEADSEAVSADGGDFEVEEDSDMIFDESARAKRQATVPTWSCTGTFSSGGTSYEVRCQTNLDVQSVTCTLDDDNYNCGGLEFSIDTSNFVNGEDHVLLLSVAARYGSSIATLRYTFRFRRQVTSQTVSCRSRSAGENVIITCTGSGITRIEYRINGGSYINAQSVSEFTVLGSQLREGENTIGLRLRFGSITRTLSLSVRKTSVVRVFGFRCSASYDEDNNANVQCSKQPVESEDIATLRYTVNGGRQTTASSVSGFVVSKSLLTREVNTISVTAISTGGLSRSFNLNLVQPLSLRCNSATSSTGITVTCLSNRQSSTLTVTCYLNGVLQANSGLNTELDFSQVGQGRHLYEVIVTDANGLKVRNQISFENHVTTLCRGSLNLGSNVFAVSCDSDRTLQYQCVLDGTVISCPDSLEIDISTLRSGQHTLILRGTDSYGNVASSTTEFFIPQEVGSCDIDDDSSDGVIDWTCSTNVAGVSIVCLVDDIRLEDCLCQLSSEFFTERYLNGDHTVSLILTGRDGSSKRFDQVFSVQPLVSSSSHAIEPLEFECWSQLKDEVVVIDCSTNKPVDLTCYLDSTEKSSCDLTGNHVSFADISQGPHTFAVVAKDQDGLVDRSEVHFEEDLDISCRGAYNPAQDVVHLDCDSTRPLDGAECQLNDGTVIQCPTPFDVPVDDFVNDLTLRVTAHDSVGNDDYEELTFLTSSCEGC